jgi:hypothetical protein
VKLGMVSTNATSPSSFYRAFGALTHLAREAGIELMISEVWDWARLAYCDALFMHCPMSAECVELAELARQTRTPLWVDHDDHVGALGRDNGGYYNIMRPEVQGHIKRCLELASVVTVSTPALRDMLWPAARVIPNTLNDYVFDFSEAPRRQVVTWRGGPAHYSDQETFGPAVARVASQHPDWEFHFMGCAHWGLEKLMPPGRFVIHEWRNLLDYAALLTELRPALHIVPMNPTRFNLAKSNCAWLEATAAGAAVLAPAWGEWMRPGIVNYAGAGGEFNAETQRAQRDAEGDSDSFERALVALLEADHRWIYGLPSTEDVLGRALDASRAIIEQDLLLSGVNKQRLAVLEDLTAQRKRATHG